MKTSSNCLSCTITLGTGLPQPSPQPPTLLYTLSRSPRRWTPRAQLFRQETPRVLTLSALPGKPLPRFGSPHRPPLSDCSLKAIFYRTLHDQVCHDWNSLPCRSSLQQGDLSDLSLFEAHSEFHERLPDADKSLHFSITIVYGRKCSRTSQMAMLRKLSGLQNLHFSSKNLHAKCYSNECSCLISSMNLYEYSEKNSFGV